jgi:hypothetical protein
VKSVLIVTRSDDNPSVDVVSRLLRARGVRPVRLDTDRYPLDVKVSTRFAGDDTRRVWKTAEGSFDVDDDLCSVWYRRFHAGASLPVELGDLRVPCVDESRRALYGMIAALDVPQLDRLEDVRRCDHKELQLQRARSLGLTIPKTLFSDDDDEVRAFFALCGGRVITKMQSSFAVMRDGIETVVFTNVVAEDDLRDLSGLRFCPMQFQELVDKKLELRATVVGAQDHDAQVFCACVDSQTHAAETRIDWRKDGVGLLKKWRPYELPSSTSQALVQLVRGFGLSYAAADFIVTPEDRLVFLEINAGGEWFWLDESFHQPGLPIAAAIADWLT